MFYIERLILLLHLEALSKVSGLPITELGDGNE
jgi:hypothetical protein